VASSPWDQDVWNRQHYNPVKHGCAARVADWPHSSFHRFVENGVYPPDWAGNLDLVDAAGFGE